MTVSIDTSDLVRLKKRIDAVLEVSKKPQLVLMQLAKGIIEQTQARIQYEKTAPDGTPWPAWSPEYAKTRDGGDSLLMDSEEMYGDFHSKVNRSGLMVWNDAVYAGAQNFGRPEINLPARTFMGFSDDNVRNINDWLAGILLGAVKGAKVQNTTRKKIKGKGKRK